MIDRFIKAKRERANQILAVKNLQETEEGRLVLKYLMQITHVMDSSKSDDTHETYYAEGERSIGLQIIRALEMPTDKLMMLIRTNIYEEDTND